MMQNAKRIFQKIRHKLSPTLGCIFMLHRVAEKDGSKLPPNENMKVSPKFLDETLATLKAKFDIIPLSSIPARLQQPQSRKFAAFTFDDGYKDNFSNALPIFKKHNVPFTIFVTTNFPDKTAILWWHELEDLILDNVKIRLSNGKCFSCKTKDEKTAAFMQIRSEILQLDQQNLRAELDSLFSPHKIDWSRKCSELCMDWDEIRALKGEPLCEIGGHTQNHFNLKKLPLDNARTEILAGNAILREKAGISPKTFAYPFGSSNEADEREFALLSTLGFQAACTADGGCVKKTDAKNIFALPRMFFNNDFHAEDLQ